VNTARPGARFASVQQLACNQTGFNGFADANIISDQQTDGIEPEGQQQRYKLIRAWLDGDTSKGAKRPALERKPKPYASRSSRHER